VELVAAGQAYFEGRGLNVLAKHRIETATADTRGIYDLTSGQAAEVLAGLDLSGVDAVLLSGTGMPSLPALATGHPSGVPVVSSNFCLAAKMVSALGRDDLLDGGLGIAGWRDRLEDALS
jgi:maleate isomerase